MVWLAALLVAGVFGLIGASWYAPLGIGVVAAVVVAIDSVAANEFTLKSVATLALVVAATFLVWGVSRAVRRFFSTAG
jgi:hypothetical protein